MHIRTISKKDGTKSYRAIIKTGSKELGKTFAKKLHAKQWATRIEHDAGLSVALGCQGVTTTFGQLVNDYETADRTEWNALPENQVQFWVDHIGSKTKLIEIRKSNIRAGIDKKRATQSRKGLPVTASTLNNYLATMRTLWRFASNKYDSISREFISDLKPRRVNNARKRFLTKDEHADLLIACGASRSCRPARSKTEWQRSAGGRTRSTSATGEDPRRARAHEPGTAAGLRPTP